jgi:O-antigen/teichoic acid export membrane protein
VGRTFETALLFGAWIALALALGAPFAIDVVAGAEFAGAVPVLRIEAVALGAAFITQTFGFALLSLHRHRELLIIHVTALLATSVLTAVLCSTHGIDGAAVAVAIGELALAAFSGIAFHRSLPRAAVPLGAIPRVVVAGAAGAGVALAVGGPSVVQAALGSAVFWGVALVVRAVPAELTEQLRAWRAR